MSARNPRVVVLTRPTSFELVVSQHGTVPQAEFFLSSRGQSLDALRVEHDAQLAAMQLTSAAIPVAWRRAHVTRAGLDRFLFEEEDIVVAIGQDGLVANAAKYLTGQAVIGINPLPDSYAGVLVPHAPNLIGDLLSIVGAGRHHVQSRTMVEARVDGGFTLRALNEIFIGHRTHQSARYRLRYRGHVERHSSSGVIVASGTGCTGWARSIHRERACGIALLNAEDPALLFFVRESFPSPGTACSMTQGVVDDEVVEITSEMNDGGVVFGDGIEADRIDFSWGKTVRIARAPVCLQLVTG